MNRTAWIIAAVVCGLAVLATVAITYTHLYEWGSGMRLAHIGIIIALGLAVGECFKKAGK